MQPALALTATRQGGAFSHAQARAAGYSPDAIRHRLRTGTWHRLRRGWYVDAGRWASTDDASAERLALVVNALQRSVDMPTWASGLTAAALWGARVLTPPPVTRLVTTGDRQHRRAKAYAIVPVQLPPHQRGTVMGIPVTSPARTFVDVARREDLESAVVVADSLLRSTALRRSDVETVLRDCWCAAGIPAVARVLELADSRSESVLESLARLFFLRHGLTPEPQVQIYDAGGFVARVDFLLRECWVVLETDGLLKYTDTSALRAEKLRQERLEQLGFTVIRVTWTELRNRPAATAARVLRGIELARSRGEGRSGAVRLVPRLAAP